MFALCVGGVVEEDAPKGVAVEYDGRPALGEEACEVRFAAAGETTSAGVAVGLGSWRRERLSASASAVGRRDFLGR
jgi:type IV secretory pathway TrbL component